jgi:hypothetical protein
LTLKIGYAKVKKPSAVDNSSVAGGKVKILSVTILTRPTDDPRKRAEEIILRADPRAEIDFVKALRLIVATMTPTAYSELSAPNSPFARHPYRINKPEYKFPEDGT